MRPSESELDSLLERAARMAAEYVAGHADRDLPVLRYLPPAELREALGLSLPVQGRGLDEILAEARKVLDYSVRTGHPGFMNQLFGGHDEAAILGEWIAALLNTSMYTFECAPVATLMEVEMIGRLCELVGFEAGEGVFCPGGSISNLVAVLTARQQLFPHVKKEGFRSDDRPVMFASREAHYSLLRAAAVTGIGLDGAIEVATDAQGRMSTEALERAVEEVGEQGRTPFLLAATSGSTVPAAFDPIDELAEVAARHGMWLHVDASYGGSLLFSSKHRHLLEGVERADSVTWNPHKMLGVPLACSAILVREKGLLAETNAMGADYLFHEIESESFDLGDLSLQCGRRVDALKLWLSWQAHGEAGYAARVEHLLELAARFAEAVRERAGFRLVREPMGPNVCFRYLPAAHREAGEEERRLREDQATVRIREHMLREGRFMLNYASVDGAATFRFVANNPRATREDLEALLDEIERVAKR